MKLCLGTVQFGMEYGIANQTGQPSLQQSLDMLHYAAGCGITTIDTANAYGTAETIVGQFIKEYGSPLQIITKLKPNLFEEKSIDYQKIIQTELESSLLRLGINFVDGFLLHTPKYIYNTDVVNALVDIKKNGLTKHIGVSIYDMPDGFAAIDSGVVDYIQLPFSIFDQRAYHSGLLQKARENNIVIFARSVFVQGLALMTEEKVADRVHKFVPHLSKFKFLSKKYGVYDIGAMLAFVRNTAGIDYLVFGVDDMAQLQENIHCFQDYQIDDAFTEELMHSFKRVDESVIIPSLWSLQK